MKKIIKQSNSLRKFDVFMIYVFYFVRNQTSQGFPEMVFKFGNFLVQKLSHTVSYFNKETENIKMDDNVQM